jgi:hypothetical protein
MKSKKKRNKKKIIKNKRYATTVILVRQAAEELENIADALIEMYGKNDKGGHPTAFGGL